MEELKPKDAMAAAARRLEAVAPGSEEAKDAHVFYEAAVRLVVAGRIDYPLPVPGYVANA
jgi:hypothetical protein